MRSRTSKAFTLVEILIVVVILGILAAIVIPQFTNASQEAQSGNVVTQTQTIRNQIELFRVRNNGNEPVMAGTGGAAFAQLLNPPAPQQPYMRTAASNPRNGSTEVQDATTTGSAFREEAAGMDPEGAAGWLYNVSTGEFAAIGYSEWSNTWFGTPGEILTDPNAPTGP